MWVRALENHQVGSQGLFAEQCRAGARCEAPSASSWARSLAAALQVGDGSLSKTCRGWATQLKMVFLLALEVYLALKTASVLSH